MNVFLNTAAPFFLTYFWVIIPVAMIAEIVIEYRSDDVAASYGIDGFLLEDHGYDSWDNWQDAHTCGSDDSSPR